MAGGEPSVPVRPRLRSRLSRVVRGTLRDLIRSWTQPELGLLALVIGFTATTGTLLSLRYLANDFHAYDFGLFVATAFYTARTGGLPLFPHFSPIVYALAPFLWAFPSPSTLLVLAAAATGAAAIPLFWLARVRLGDPWLALVLAAAFLVGFLSLATIWSGFYPEAFLTAAFLAALYARERGHLVGFITGLLIALAATEAALPLVALLAGFTLLRAGWRRHEHREWRSDWRLGRAGLVLVGVWSVVLLSLPFVPPGGASSNGSASNYLGLVFAQGWWHLGATSVLDIVPAAILHPALAWSSLRTNGTDKVLYILLLFGAFGFLPFFGPLDELVLGLVWPALAVLSTDPAHVTFGTPFIAYTLPFLIAASLGGITRIARWMAQAADPDALVSPRRVTPNRRRYAVTASVTVLLVGMLLATSVATPLLSVPVDATPGGVYGPPVITAHDRWLVHVVGLLPKDAAVLTTNGIFPFVSTDPKALFAPISPFLYTGTSFATRIQAETNVSRYVLLDYFGDWQNTILLVTYGNLSEFHLVATVDGIRLLERGPESGSLLLDVPEGWSIPLTSFVPFDSTLTLSSNGTPELVSDRGGPPGAILWYGPSEILAPGSFRLTLTFSLGSENRSTIAQVGAFEDPISVDQVVLASISGAEWQGFDIGTGALAPFPLGEVNLTGAPGPRSVGVTFAFNWPGLGLLELPSTIVDPDAAIALTGVEIQDVTPSA